MEQNYNKSLFKKCLYHLLAIICFLVVTFTYFSPLLEGKTLAQSDIQQYSGMSKELRDYYYLDGESSEWTGSMFSGMPAYQIGVWGGPTNFLDYLEYPLKVLGGADAGPVFTGMLMAYILFCIMGVGFIPALIGAVAYSLSSYNIIIIDAGHVTKAWAIAYMPLVISSFAAAFKRKYLLSGVLMALGLALQLKSNHLQITYYTALLCVFLYIGLIVDCLRNKNISGLLKSTGLIVLGVILAVLCNLGNIYSNYEMSHESMRGKSELSQSSATEKQSSGLDKDYAFSWSYGKAETLSLLIPDVNGGASGGMLSPDSRLYKTIQVEAPGSPLDSKGIQAYTYWGEQPFTSGPVYFGAIICFLFVLGMFLIKNPTKWILFIATVFFIFLSWGSNFETFNNWFFYHFPLYNKFRAVSTALVIPAITVLIIAIWGLSEFYKELQSNKKNLLRSIYISGGITGGLCLLLFLVPGIFGFDFKSSYDAAWINNVPQWYYNALIADRKDLLSSDALRSLIYIALAALILYFITKSKKSSELFTYGLLTLLVLVIIDLGGVDKRYLNNDKFQSKTVYNIEQQFPKTVANQEILKDKDPSYRVLNLNNPFNETQTSYYHKSIGGYHAAKLKRYQELIEYNLQDEIKNIIESFQSNNIDSIMADFRKNTALNMLNARYIIYSPEQAPLFNPYAMGNAWFVNDYKLVDNADQEIAAIKGLDAKKTAIIDKQFAEELSGLSIVPDSNSMSGMKLVEYAPNYLKYQTFASSEQLAVMSEIYYPKGWEAYLDGKPVPHIRADWTLRAMRIPAGTHEVEFKFIPKGYNTSRTVASVSSGILILLLIGFIIKPLIRKEK